MSIRSALNKAGGSDPFSGFVVCNLDDSTSTNYFGFVSLNGAWLIKQLNTTTGEIRYAAGDTGYTTSWTGRAALTYTLPDVAG